MKIIVNALPHEISSTLLSDALVELGFTAPSIATALNGGFVPKDDRAATSLSNGDQLEVLSPMQGG